MTSRPRGRPAGSTAKDTKADLLRAARVVFAEHGYAGSSIGQIVERAGVTPPVLYHHFDSKARLYIAATQEIHDLVLTRLEAAVAQSDTITECVDQILAESARMHSDDPTMAAFIVSAPVAVEIYPELGPVSVELGRITAFLDRVVRRTGGIPGHTNADSTRALRMLFWGMTRLSASVERPAEFASAVDALRDLVVGGALAGQITTERGVAKI